MDATDPVGETGPFRLYIGLAIVDDLVGGRICERLAAPERTLELILARVGSLSERVCRYAMVAFVV